MKKILIFFFIILFSNALNGMEISGIPKIIDGDTVHINKLKIRLEHIDAPEIKQECKKDFFKISSTIGFNFKKTYFCGRVSKIKLKEKVNNSKIRCISLSKDRYQRFLATCYKDNINLNKWMVMNGYAVAYKRYSGKYLNEENYARENKLGIWKGTFLRPEKWRKNN